MSRGLQKPDPGSKERNNYPGGRSGSKDPLMMGPATGKGDLGRNSTRSGGINRATKGTGAGAMNYKKGGGDD